MTNSRLSNVISLPNPDQNGKSTPDRSKPSGHRPRPNNQLRPRFHVLFHIRYPPTVAGHSQIPQ